MKFDEELRLARCVPRWLQEKRSNVAVIFQDPAAEAYYCRIETEDSATEAVQEMSEVGA